MSIKDIQLNEEIRDLQVRLLSEDGEPLGIVTSKEALSLAASKNLDLVKIAPMASPPVCKIMDYGKFRFEQTKKEKEAKKNQHTASLKEIRLSLNIDTNDLNTKLKQAEKFIKEGNKIKISIRFKGREMGHPELGTKVMKKFYESCGEFSNVEKMPLLNGRSMFMFIAPKSSK